jgi:hypothetical protein
MYALVDNNDSVTIVNSNKGITIGENKYPKAIFTLWTNEEREAIGIYEVQVDSTNKKDEEYYINTDISYSFLNGVVTGSYGTPTAKSLDDTFYTSQDQTDGLIPEGKSVGDVSSKGLKSLKKENIKKQAADLLAKTDWHVIKATEVSEYSVPSEISTYRSNVRAKSNEMESQINACTTVDELAALYIHTETDGVISRPLAQFPEEV